MEELELPFKVLYQNKQMYICDLDADELENLDSQQCWRSVNMEDAGIR